MVLHTVEREVEVKGELVERVCVQDWQAPESVARALVRKRVVEQEERGVGKNVREMASRLVSEAGLVISLKRDAMDVLLSEKYQRGARGNGGNIAEDMEALSGLAMSTETLVSTVASVLKLGFRVDGKVRDKSGKVSDSVEVMCGIWGGAKAGRPTPMGLMPFLRVVEEDGVPQVVYRRVMRRLQEDESLGVGLQASVGLLRARGESLSPFEWEVVVGGQSVLEAAGGDDFVIPPKPREAWLSLEMWRGLTLLEKFVPRFSGVVRSVLRETELWYTLVHSSAPLAATTSVPSLVDTLSPLGKILLFRIVRPGVTETAIRDVIAKHLGPGFDGCGVVDPEVVWREDVLPHALCVIYGDSGRVPERWVKEWWARDVVDRREGARIRVVDVGGEGGVGGGLEWDDVRNGVMRGDWFVFRVGGGGGSRRDGGRRWLGGLVEMFRKMPGGGKGGLKVGRVARGPAPTKVGRVFVTTTFGSRIPGELTGFGSVVVMEWTQCVKRQILEVFKGPFRGLGERANSAARAMRRILFGMALLVGHVNARRGLVGVHGWVGQVRLSELGLVDGVKWMASLLEGMLNMDGGSDTELGAFVPFADIQGIARMVFGMGEAVDRDVLALAVERCVGEFLFDDKHSLSASNHNLRPPPFGSMEFAAEFVERAFPVVTPLDILGLRNKLSVRIGEERSGLVFAQLARSLGMGQAVPEAPLVSVSSVTRVVQRIRDSLGSTLPGRGGFVQPVFDSVLESESVALGEVLDVVSAWVRRLLGVISGKVPLDREAYDVWAALQSGRVPSTWCADAGSWTLDGWLDWMVRRVSQMSIWISHGLPVVMNLGLLDSPNKLLARLLVAATKAAGNDSPIHAFGFDFVVQRPGVIPREHPPVGVYIGGLWIDNAAWDVGQKVLVEVPGHELSGEMPVVWIRPCDVKDLGGERMVYGAPLYRRAGASAASAGASAGVSAASIGASVGGASAASVGGASAASAASASGGDDDSGYIFDVALPISGDEGFWKLRGVRLWCE